MSNPSGTGRDGGPTSDGASGGYPPDADEDPVTEVNDPITEVIDTPGGSPADTAQRRYTAPGFDAGSTQIIDRLPEDSVPTEVLFTTGRPRAAAPTTIPPHRPDRPSWLVPILVALAALIAAALLGFLLYHRATAAKAARVDAVRATIENFDNAVHNGDLGMLRSITCGATKQTYDNYDDRAWADAYTRITETKQYPVVASIDEIVVNDDHAEANVTSYLALDPETTSTRSFDLHYRDGQWRICQSP
jgi:hypothetical protein